MSRARRASFLFPDPKPQTPDPRCARACRRVAQQRRAVVYPIPVPRSQDPTLARTTGPKLVQCYLCGRRFEVSAMAQSTSCPGCNKPVMVADEVIKKVRGPIRELKTCGKITVMKKARLMAEQIVAHAGIENLGTIEAKKVVTGGGLILGPKSEFRGELHSQWVHMEEGAKIRPSAFHVPSDPSGLLKSDEPPIENDGPGPDQPPGPGDTLRGDAPPEPPPMKTSSTRNLPRPEPPVRKKVTKKVRKKKSTRKKPPPEPGDKA